jgi:tRNA (guanine37-N1)-methyltransferase
MRFDIITIFPKIFDSYLNESLIKRARKKKLIDIKIRNLRDFTTDKHRKVDDKPFGGGPGMVLKIEPIYRAVKSLKSKIKNQKLKIRTILFSRHGKKLDAKAARRLAKYDRLILICGRYEGVDERAAKYVADEEISIGDYVLSGGELPALVLIESVSRFLPGFLGKTESLEEIKGSYPVYTRPEVFLPSDKQQATSGKRITRTWRVPKVLLSGNHKKINEWRRGKSGSG